MGDNANGGKECELEGKPTRAGVHDSPDPDMGKAIPYSRFNVSANYAWVSAPDVEESNSYCPRAYQVALAMASATIQPVITACQVPPALSK